MSNPQSAPASPPARGLFTTEQEAFLLSQAVGEPTGEKVTIGGVEIDLVPLSTQDGIFAVNTITRFQAIWSKLQGGGGFDESEIVKAIEKDVPEILAIAKRIVRESAIAAGGDFDEDVFERWYGRTRFVPTLRTLVPAVLRANGFGQFAERIERPTTAATPIGRRRRKTA